MVIQGVRLETHAYGITDDDSRVMRFEMLFFQYIMKVGQVEHAMHFITHFKDLREPA